MNTEQLFVRENRGVIGEAIAGKGDLVYRCRIISAGEGSSAYYMGEVLDRDKNILAPVGTKSYWNHPSLSEGWERPERDAEKIAAVQISAPEYDPTDQSLYADYKFDETRRQYVETFAPYLGMSIYALAESQVGNIGDYTGEIITRFVESPFNSVDVVTVAGANGAILQKVSEGYKKAFVSSGTSTTEATNPHPQQKEPELDIKDLEAALATQAAAIVSAITEALKPKPADAVKESASAEFELIAESGLPKEAREVVYKAVEAGTPAVEAIAAQKQYVNALETAITKRLEEAGSIPAGRVLGEAASDVKFRGFRSAE